MRGRDDARLAARAVPRPGAPGGDREGDGRCAGRHRPRPPDGRTTSRRRSTKMFEYMARGLPVVCSNFPLWAEIVGGADCGIAVDPRDPAAIADAIRRLDEDPALARRLGENGRRRSPSATTGRRRSSSSRRCTAGSRDAVGRGAGRVRAGASLHPRRRPRRLARAGLEASRRPIAAMSASPRRGARRAVRASCPTCSSPPRGGLADPASMPSVRVREGCPSSTGPRRAGGPEVDVFGSAFFMLTRYEELVVADRDGSGASPPPPRSPAAAASSACRSSTPRSSCCGTPCSVRGRGLRRRPHAFEVTPHPRRRRSARDARSRRRATSSRQLAGDLVTATGSRGWRSQRVRSLRGDRRLDPHNAFDFLMDVSERHGLRSAFYFLAHRDQRTARRRVPVRAPVGARR